jgi:AraC-like DNA-binding protein
MVSLCISKDFLEPCRSALVNTAMKNLSMYNAFRPYEKNVLYRTIKKLAQCKAGPELEEGAFVSRARRLLELSPDSRITIRQLAESEAVCEDHMIREFKRKVGLTPRQFQIQNRVRMAQLLLEEGSSASEAALSAGFYDQSHLDKYFRRFLGIPPREYIKAYKGHVFPAE